MLLRKIQQQFESIYQLPRYHSVEDFLIDRTTLEKLRKNRNALPHQFTHGGAMLLFPEGDRLELGVYLNEHILQRLSLYNPFLGLNEKNLHSFCIVAEEVSHFLYITWKVLRCIQLTRLELELQAEVDKFILCTFYSLQKGSTVHSLPFKKLLFDTFSLEKDLSPELQNRYFTASRLARHYCHYLENRFLKKTLILPMIHEIRRFYRLGQTEKISHINRTVFSQ